MGHLGLQTYLMYRYFLEQRQTRDPSFAALSSKVRAVLGRGDERWYRTMTYRLTDQFIELQRKKLESRHFKKDLMEREIGI